MKDMVVTNTKNNHKRDKLSKGSLSEHAFEHNGGARKTRGVGSVSIRSRDGMCYVSYVGRGQKSSESRRKNQVRPPPPLPPGTINICVPPVGGFYLQCCHRHGSGRRFRGAGMAAHAGRAQAEATTPRSAGTVRWGRKCVHTHSTLRDRSVRQVSSDVSSLSCLLTCFLLALSGVRWD